MSYSIVHTGSVLSDWEPRREEKPVVEDEDEEVTE